MQPLLEIKGLCTEFRTAEGILRAADDVSLSIPHGGIVALVGESGCGKSVTALSILRLIADPPGKIVSGEIWLNTDVGAAPRGRPQVEGQPASCAEAAASAAAAEHRVAPTPGCINLLQLSEKEMCALRGNRIAMIFQEPMTSLNPVFTIGDQIEEAILLHQRASGSKVSKKEARLQTIEMLKKVGIPNPEQRIDDYPHQMSGGMRQRVMIAMALSCHPDLLIADEPTTALDVTIQAQILELICGLVKEMGMSLLLITHDLGIVAEYAQEVAVMYAGHIVEQAKVEDLFAHPLHPYTKGLLESIPSLQKKGEVGALCFVPLRSIPGSVPRLTDLPVGCRFQDRCERVQEDCRRQDPALEEKRTGHYARCFHPYDTMTR